MWLVLVQLLTVYAEYDDDLARDSVYWAAAAYCDLDQINAWNCGVPCDKHPNFNLHSTWNITTDGDELSNIIVGIDADSTDLIVAFQGTKGIEELISELTDFDLVDYTPHVLPGATVDKFFLDAYKDSSAGVLGAIKELRTDVQRVLFIGHSLGGSIAALTAIDVVLSGIATSEDVYLYTYGEPRCGNEAFADYFDTFVPQAYRVVHYADLVPHIPPGEIVIPLYEHHSTEIWYDYDFANYTICGPLEDPNCSDSLWTLELSIDQHRTYFGIRPGGSCNATSLIIN